MAAALPLITRLYSPEKFGEFGVFVAMSSFSAIFATLRFEIAVPIPKAPEEAWNITLLSLLLALAISAFGVIFGLSCPEVAWMPISYEVLPWVAVTACLIALITVNEAWLNRNRHFGNVAKGRFIGAIVITIFQIGLPSFAGNYGVNGLWVGFIVGMAVTLLISFRYSLALKPAGFVFMPVATAKKYHSFPKYLLVAHLINSAASQAPVIFIKHFFGASITGLYFAASRTLSMIDLVPTAVGQVFFNEFSRNIANHKPVFPLLKSITIKLIYIGAGLYSLFFIFSPQIFKYVFGEEWVESGYYARILIPMFFIRFFTVPSNVSYASFNAQNVFMYRQLVNLILVVVGLYLGQKHSFDLTIMIYSAVLILGYIFDGTFIGFQSHKRDQTIASQN